MKKTDTDKAILLGIGLIGMIVSTAIVASNLDNPVLEELKKKSKQTPEKSNEAHKVNLDFEEAIIIEEVVSAPVIEKTPAIEKGVIRRFAARFSRMAMLFWKWLY